MPKSEGKHTKKPMNTLHKKEETTSSSKSLSNHIEIPIVDRQ